MLTIRTRPQTIKLAENNIKEPIHEVFCIILAYAITLTPSCRNRDAESDVKATVGSSYKDTAWYFEAQQDKEQKKSMDMIERMLSDASMDIDR